MFRLFLFGMTVLAPSMADVFTCPATQAAVATFEPSGTFAGRANHVFGSEKLFTVFPGNWQSAQRGSRGYRVPRIVWGSNVFDLSKEVGGSALTITGRRLDAASGPLEFDGASTAWDNRGYFITSEFYVPSPGCWEVTGHFHGADLKIVVDLK